MKLIVLGGILGTFNWIMGLIIDSNTLFWVGVAILLGMLIAVLGIDELLDKQKGTDGENNGTKS